MNHHRDHHTGIIQNDADEHQVPPAVAHDVMVTHFVMLSTSVRDMLVMAIARAWASCWPLPGCCCCCCWGAMRCRAASISAIRAGFLQGHKQHNHHTTGQPHTRGLLREHMHMAKQACGRHTALSQCMCGDSCLHQCICGDSCLHK